MFHQLLTSIVLVAVATTQLFGNSVIRTLRCADGGCRCSAQERSNGNCCCCTNESCETRSCCATSRASNRCQKPSSSDEPTRKPTICRCGCQDSPPPPLRSDSTSKELIRLLCETTPAYYDSEVSVARTFTFVPQSLTFFGGLSPQPLFCSWLI